ncbi:MAG: deoxyribonuclease IV [Mycobacteriales bacterium]
MPVAGGLARGGLAYAERIGAEAVQVFVSNPRGWAASPGDPADDARFRDRCRAASIPVFVHAPYLINFGSPTPATVQRSLACLEHAMSRGRLIGARGVVVHAGSAVAAGHREAALRQLREMVLPVLDRLTEADPLLLVEPTAGGGEPLAARVGDLAGYFDALDHHPRLGVCLDTCHAFAAGHDLATPGGIRSTLNALVRAVGRGRLGLVHVNDSADPLGSGRDRHATLGAGRIGAEALRELFVHPATRGVALVVETPGGEAGHRADVALLRDLRATAR